MVADLAEADFRVLHALRCIGFASADRVAEAAGVSDVVAVLAALSHRGLVLHDSGPFGGWGITDAGRAADVGWVRAELEATGSRAAVTVGFEAFLLLNPRLLEACHDWQMRRIGTEAVTNDHRDPDYDAGVIDRLMGVDEGLRPVLASVSGSLSRFARYGDRLADALDRVLAGDHASFADALDSYHSVWFQLHEDLLATLEIPRF